MINLEEELIKQNKKIFGLEDLLVINEYERLERGELNNLEVLSRVGVASNIISGKNIKSKHDRNFELTKEYDQERVFHVSQIQATCEKYYLKFLPSFRYKGSLDNQLALKINAFEINHNVKCHSSGSSYSNINNTFIMAPPSSFKLEERPKDPLFFYKINEEYYYLIHKWGSDLSITNRLKSIFTSTILSHLVCLLVMYLAISFTITLWVTIPLGIIYGLFLFISFAVFLGSDGDDKVAFYRKNIWDSEFKD